MFSPFPPLRFAPLFRSYLWGGRRLATNLGKSLPSEGIWAESWEIVDHPQGQSVVTDGPWADWTLGELVQKHRESILGPARLSIEVSRFPLLLKYLDCQNVLSVQVHPDDAYASTMPQPDLGKTEAWYIVEAEPGAVLYAGLKSGVTRRDLEDAIQRGNTESCLHQLTPSSGDCIFIPAGTVHALGAGLVVAEIQQASDCTFRLYDWNRVDASGNPRPLHVAQALDVIDFESGPVSGVSPQRGSSKGEELLVDCDRFRLVRYEEPGTHAIPLNSFQIVTVPQGTALIETSTGTMKLERGESALIPHASRRAELKVESRSVVLMAEPR